LRPGFSRFAPLLALIGVVPAAANNVCRSVPTDLQEHAAQDAFGAADAGKFAAARAPLEAALDAFCNGDAAEARRFRKRANKVVFQMAADATEPTAYFEDGVLIVEFYGGPFQAARLRQQVKAALRGKASDSND
jgi:hypothetical protein